MKNNNKLNRSIWILLYLKNLENGENYKKEIDLHYAEYFNISTKKKNKDGSYKYKQRCSAAARILFDIQVSDGTTLYTCSLIESDRKTWKLTRLGFEVAENLWQNSYNNIEGLRVATLEAIKYLTFDDINIKNLRSSKAVKKNSKRLINKDKWRNIVIRGFDRDQDLKNAVKKFANGSCPICGYKSFRKQSNNELYLEEHHIKRLADGGEDTAENVIALCANCHRKFHYGQLNDEELNRVNEFTNKFSKFYKLKFM